MSIKNHLNPGKKQIGAVGAMDCRRKVLYLWDAKFWVIHIVGDGAGGLCRKGRKHR